MPEGVGTDPVRQQREQLPAGGDLPGETVRVGDQQRDTRHHEQFAPGPDRHARPAPLDRLLGPSSSPRTGPYLDHDLPPALPDHMHALRTRPGAGRSPRTCSDRPARRGPVKIRQVQGDIHRRTDAGRRPPT